MQHQSILVITPENPTEGCPNEVASALLRQTNSHSVVAKRVTTIGKVLYVLVEGVFDAIVAAAKSIDEYFGINDCTVRHLEGSDSTAKA
jgi:hypothetical protein